MIPRIRVEELFQHAAKISGAVGLQLSLIKGDERLDLIHGFANAELGIPMTHDTVVQIGSTTKLFNATMIMSLVDEGRLDLDVPVKTYIPEFETADPRASRSITLRHLLSMSAGIDNGDYGDYGIGSDALAKRVAAMKGLPQHAAPGKCFGYSNAGTDVAGHVAERVTGKLWDDLIRERILEPAGLRNSVSLDDDRMFQRVSVGHLLDTERGGSRVIRPWRGISRGLSPAGATLTTSARDLALFAKIFVDRGVAHSGARILSEESVATMMTAQIGVPTQYYATGWCVGPFTHRWSEKPIWGHHGGNTSGGSFVYWLPEQRAVLACTCNTQSLSVYSRLVKAVTQDLMGAVFGVRNPAVDLSSSPPSLDLGRYVGTYESLAGECVVEASGKTLIMHTNWHLSALMAQFVNTVTLRPLGGDRFLIDHGDETDSLSLPEDMGFYGDDGEGRASNMVRVLFPCSRKR